MNEITGKEILNMIDQMQKEGRTGNEILTAIKNEVLQEEDELETGQILKSCDTVLA